MEDKEKEEPNRFTEIVKKAYNKGIYDNEITIDKLVEELKEELKKLLVS